MNKYLKGAGIAFGVLISVGIAALACQKQISEAIAARYAPTSQIAEYVAANFNRGAVETKKTLPMRFNSVTWVDIAADAKTKLIHLDYVLNSGVEIDTLLSNVIRAMYKAETCRDAATANDWNGMVALGWRTHIIFRQDNQVVHRIEIDDACTPADVSKKA